MHVRVRVFAGLAQMIGAREFDLDVPGADVAAVRRAVAAAHPIVEPFLRNVVCAVGEEYVPDTHRLRDGDEVALIPPVSGGRR